MNKQLLKILIATLFFGASVIFLSSLNHRVYSQTKFSTSVLDYYLKLPDKYFPNVKSNRSARLGYIRIRDVRNGYLQIIKPYQLQTVRNQEDRELIQSENQAAKRRAAMEIALFKHDEGHHIVAVFYRTGGDCPACALPQIDFWKDQNGELIDVTETIKSTIDAEMAYAQFESANKTGDSSDRKQAIENFKQDFGYELPRSGKTIKIVIDREYTEKKVELLNFRWTGREFVSEPISRI